MRHILIITSGIYYNPNYIQVIERYKTMSDNFSGIIFFTINDKNKSYVKHYNFEFYGLYLWKSILNNSFFRNIFYISYVFSKSIYFHYYKKKFDVLVVQDAFKTGVLGLLLKYVLGVKCIVEVIGNLNKSFELDSGKYTLTKKFKHIISNTITPYVLNRADGIRLLYKGQIDNYLTGNISKKLFIFHEFVPISLFKEKTDDKEYILCIGGPWYLKGVDILINAFKIFDKKHPGYSLKIFGFSDDNNYFIQQAEGFKNIELNKPISYKNVISMMSKCSIFVLPSRTEAMGCVMIEAMASRKPVIASNVDGIPSYLIDGFNGLLFKSGDITDLSEKMCKLIENKDLADVLASNAYRYVHESISEVKYVQEYNNMVESLLIK